MAKPLLGSLNTVQKASIGGAGAKLLLGSLNTVQRASTGGAGEKPLLGSKGVHWGLGGEAAARTRECCLGLV